MTSGALPGHARLHSDIMTWNRRASANSVVSMTRRKTTQARSASVSSFKMRTATGTDGTRRNLSTADDAAGRWRCAHRALRSPHRRIACGNPPRSWAAARPRSALQLAAGCAVRLWDASQLQAVTRQGGQLQARRDLCRPREGRRHCSRAVLPFPILGLRGPRRGWALTVGSRRDACDAAGGGRRRANATGAGPRQRRRRVPAVHTLHVRSHRGRRHGRRFRVRSGVVDGGAASGWLIACA